MNNTIKILFVEEKFYIIIPKNEIYTFIQNKHLKYILIT